VISAEENSVLYQPVQTEHSWYPPGEQPLQEPKTEMQAFEAQQ